MDASDYKASAFRDKVYGAIDKLHTIKILMITLGAVITLTCAIILIVYLVRKSKHMDDKEVSDNNNWMASCQKAPNAGVVVTPKKKVGACIFFWYDTDSLLLLFLPDWMLDLGPFYTSLTDNSKEVCHFI